MIIVVFLLYPGLRLALSEWKQCGLLIENEALFTINKDGCHWLWGWGSYIGLHVCKLTCDWLKDVRFQLPCTLWKYAAGSSIHPLIPYCPLTPFTARRPTYSSANPLLFSSLLFTPPPIHPLIPIVLQPIVHELLVCLLLPANRTQNGNGRRRQNIDQEGTDSSKTEEEVAGKTCKGKGKRSGSHPQQCWLFTIKQWRRFREGRQPRIRSGQWRSNRGFSRFKEPGPPTVRGPRPVRESRETSNEHKSLS